MSRFDVDGTVHTATLTLRSDITTVLIVDDIEAAMDAAIACLTRRLDAYMAEGSGWTLDAVVNITVHMAAYQPLHGATYLPTPPKLARHGRSSPGTASMAEWLRAWDTFATMKLWRREVVSSIPDRGTISRMSFLSNQATGTVFSSEYAFLSKF